MRRLFLPSSHSSRSCSFPPRRQGAPDRPATSSSCTTTRIRPRSRASTRADWGSPSASSTRTPRSAMPRTFRAGALNSITADPRVDFVEPDSTVHVDTTEPNATWGIDRIDQRRGAGSRHDDADRRDDDRPQRIRAGSGRAVQLDDEGHRDRRAQRERRPALLELLTRCGTAEVGPRRRPASAFFRERTGRRPWVGSRRSAASISGASSS